MPFWTETQKGGAHHAKKEVYEKIPLKEFKKLKKEMPAIKISYADEQKMHITENQEFYLHFISKGMLQRSNERMIDSYKAEECVKLSNVNVNLMPYLKKPVMLEIIVTS